MFVGMAIAFIIWVTYVVAALLSLDFGEHLDPPRVFLAFVIIVGLGTAIGFLIQHFMAI